MPTESKTLAAIAELHEWYCERTGLRTKLCFAERLWYDRLKDYEFNQVALRADCELIVRYLKKAIAQDRRMIGALKLSNFLQPDSFDSDLAIARLQGKEKSRPANHANKRDKEKDEEPITEEQGRELAGKMRRFREELRHR